MGRWGGVGYSISKAAKHGGVGWCRGDDTAKVAIMGSVGGYGGDGELAICVRLAQAPADHLLGYQKRGMRWKWGLGDGCRFW